MRTLVKNFSIFLLLLTLTSCIEVQYKMFLRNDGSGRIEETIYMNSAMVQMMKGFMAMGNDSTSQKEFSLFDEEELRAAAKKIGKGVRYISGKGLKENGREGHIAVYEFDDINKIKMDEDLSDKASPMGEKNDTPEDDITFKFSKGSPATLIINMPEDEEKNETEVEGEEMEIESETNEDLDEEWTEEMKNMMKDFRIAIMIEFEGDIIETNATYVDGSTVTLLEMDFDKIMDDPEKLKKLKSLDDNSSFEETKELLKDVPGIKFETNQEVKVVFE